MKKYHYNPQLKTVSECGANKGKCPWGGPGEHFPTEEAAWENWAANNGVSTVPSGNKRLSETSQRNLKEMDADELAVEFFAITRDIGLDEGEMSSCLELSSILHANQKRRNRAHHARTPYIEHPLRVSIRLMRAGATDPSAIKAAILHDAVEDGSKDFADRFLGKDATEEEARRLLLGAISKSHGADTAKLIASVSNDIKPEGPQSFSEKCSTYYKHLRHEILGPGLDERTVLLKWSDFVDNAGSLHHTDLPGTEEKTFKQAAKYVACVQIFRDSFAKGNPHVPQETIEAWLERCDLIEGRLVGFCRDYGHFAPDDWVPPAVVTAGTAGNIGS